MSLRDKISSQTAIDAEASQWVVRRRAELAADEENQLAAWLAADPAHQAAFTRLSAVAEVFQRARAQGQATTIVTELETRSRRRRTRRRVMGAASALIAFAAVFLWFNPLRGPQPVPGSQLIAEFEPMRKLPDGSIVELKTGTEIAVRFEPGFRRIDLVRGEALFRVEKDPARPFIVGARGVAVRAVGTAFNVRLEAAAVEVLVTEGKVRVEDALRGSSLLPAPAPVDVGEGGVAPAAEPPVLGAGEKVVVTLDSAGVAQPAEVVQLGADEIKQRLAWRVPRFEFDGIELAAAIREMNRDNRVQIVLADDSLAALHISGTFYPDDPQTFTRLVAATFGLKAVTQGENEIVLAKK